MIRDKIYLFGILFMVVGLSFSRAFVSLSYVVIIAAWLFDKDVFKKFGLFFKNKPAWILASIYLMHLLGLLYTSDFSYAWLDIRTKIPILILPLVFSTMNPLSKREFIAVLLVFSLTVVGSMGTALFWFFKDSLVDFREAFHFVSHIRLGLMSVIAISVFGWLTFKKSLGFPLWTKVIFMVLSLFLLWAIAVLEIMSGMLLFVLTSGILAIVFWLKASRKYSLWIAMGFIGVLIAIASYLFIVIDNYYKVSPPKTIAEKTNRGNRYENQENQFPVENGNYIGRQICWKEMRQVWNQKSSINFDSLDRMNNPIRYTLLRYLNSKHLTKDFEGVNQLSESDVSFIEKGFANVEYTKKFSLKKRIYKILWEYSIYKKEGKIRKSSGIKRLYLWETGLHLVAQHPFFGVGTGDVKAEFSRQLQEEKSPLQKDRLRSHNQYISIAIAFGIIGLLWFVFAILYPFISTGRFDFLMMAFLIIYLLSMFWEDSLETQIGVTIFAFFYPLFLFQNPTIKETF